MAVFVAGVHGVGKSYLCQQYVDSSLVVHESASGLIRKERSGASWGVDKRVANVDENQVYLQRAVQRIISEGKNLLLDGHFVLIGEDSAFVSLESQVFHGLNISGVVLVEAEVSIIASRLFDRDSAKSAVDIAAFLKAEREQAELVCKDLNVPLHILFQPEIEGFSKVVDQLFGV